MVRLADLPDYEREHLLGKNTTTSEPTPWVAGDTPLGQRRIALVTTAGLHLRDDDGFGLADAGYRLIPGEIDAGDLVMSQTSVNFDRTGFLDDVNVVFPLERFRELAAEGVVGPLASQHVSFMGAGVRPESYAESARRLAGLLIRDAVDTVFLTPV